VNNEMKPATATVVDEAYYEQLANDFESEDYELPSEAVVICGEGDEPGRAILAPYMTPEALDAASRQGRGRPRLSAAGTGRSPKRQVRLPEELDAALVRLAQAQGLTPSAVVREAVETYVRSA
jgi:hypothetical protein